MSDERTHHIKGEYSRTVNTLCGIRAPKDTAWYGYDLFTMQPNQCPECLVIAGLLYDIEKWKKGDEYYTIERCRL